MLRKAANGTGWILAGSANVSTPAWGTFGYVYERQKNPSAPLKVGLWELGVLLTKVRVDDYDVPFDYTQPRRYDAVADQPCKGAACGKGP